MSLITVDFTGGLSQREATTQPDIIRRFLTDLGLGEVRTASSGTTTTVVDSTLVDAAGGAAGKSHGWIRMVSGTANNLGLIRAIQGFAPGTGTYTVTAFPDAVAASDRFEIWRTPPDVHPDVVLDMLRQLIEGDRLPLPSTVLLSELPDYDMEQSGTSAYADTNATLAKVSRAVGTEGVFGAQALSVATTAAGGYAESARDIRVEGATSAWAGVAFTPADPTATNTGFLSIIDSATGAAYDTIQIEAKATVRVLKQISLPDSARIKMRFGSLENGVTGIWDDLILIDANSYDKPLPWWVSRRAQIRGIGSWVPQQSGVGESIYSPTIDGPLVSNWTVIDDRFGNGQLRLVAGAMGVPFIQGLRFERNYLGGSVIATETKQINTELAAAGLAVAYYERLLASAPSSPMVAKFMEDRLGEARDRFARHRRRVYGVSRTDRQARSSQWTPQEVFGGL